MTKLAKILAMAVCLGLLAIGLSFLTSTPAPASTPLPVNLAQVSVSSVPVSGTVNVGNTPSVNVANTPTVNFAAGSTVKVSNPEDASNNAIPLATLDATRPVEEFCQIPFLGAPSGSCNFSPPPTGTRLVIQEVDVEWRGPIGLKPVFIQVITNPSVHVPHFFTAVFMGTNTVDDVDMFATHQETHLYVNQGETPACGVAQSAPNVGPGFENFATCSLSGFLVDVP